MRRGGLFLRGFSAIMASTLVSILLFSVILVTTQQQTNQRAYENEIRLQAYEIADYMTNLDQIGSIRDNVTMRYIVGRKITEIYETYNADIWIVSFQSGRVQVLDRSWRTSDRELSDSVFTHLARIRDGNEIRETDLFTEMGEHIITIGVPWRYNNGSVVGAVLLHISADSLKVSNKELVKPVVICALVTLLIGTVIALILARSQTKPLKEIDNAVREFSKGNLTRRVRLDCGGELQNLGNSINRMAGELSQLDESRRNFVAAVSHELRSPMTCIRGYVPAMMDETIPQEEYAGYLKIVLAETNRLTALVNDLLEISRLESGRIPLEIAPFDVNETIRRLLINYMPRIEEKHIDVDMRFEGDNCMVNGDMARINQVLSNFVDNALKFMEAGKGVLTVKTETLDKRVRITVSDNGCGIDEKDLPHIFERFYKADKAHTSGMGTGLGLSICRLIVREHGSEITVQSEPGNTSFSFLLPKA
ncbi:MAG: HAMP domain-containing histidine kinase [Clostridia bacterium]|nr:HAMP domain-containing histidine kinase [Clostridia bacterium]